jgi:hypothetical protein
MKQTDGMKVIVLTRGYLTDMRKQSRKHGRKKVNREKSAEAIVLGDDITQEGPNLKE